MLGFIQGLLLIIIEVSIYFFYAQTFCEAGDKITVKRTIATVVISVVLLDVISTIFAKYFVIKLLMIVLVLSIMLQFSFRQIGERVLCLQQYIKVLFWLLIFVLLFWQVCFWKIGLFHYRRRRCYLLYCQKVSCFV
ncbi:hypothetical protein [Clostridium sp. AM49-4BH]|uniref:hypothetical protein n=1 Tax=Clostridium sp. AM49-4BH TaxID=2293035 RepID=UPI0015F82009|nr:hypothetical protein [Clostridium sp. AM49-4BH]